MKAKYHVVYHVGDKRFEFETVIERSDSPEQSDVISKLSAKVLEYHDSLYGEGAFHARYGFFDMKFDFLGPA